MDKKDYRIPAKALRWSCDIGTIKGISSEIEIFGQSRAVSAIELGLSMDHPGYHIFISGAAGTGRTTTVRELLKKVKGEPPSDIVFVHNFDQPDNPLCLVLEAGKGNCLKREMDALIEQLSAAIPKVLESDTYQNRKTKLIESLRSEYEKIIQAFDKKAQKKNFRLVQVQIGPYTKPDIFPVVDGEPVQPDKLDELVQQNAITSEQAEAFVETYKTLYAELKKITKSTQKLEREIRNKVEEFQKNAVKPVIEEALQEIRDRFQSDKVRHYLDRVLDDLLENLDLFRLDEAKQQDQKAVLADPFLPYRINVLVDHSRSKGEPVIFETSPTFSKLFGNIDKNMDQNGRIYSNFTNIRAGSLLQANGGYLVLYARDVLSEVNVWNKLKRVLKSKSLDIQGFDPYHPGVVSALKPEAVEIKLKVIFIGDPVIYRLLYNADEDFSKIFKIKADFDYEMTNRRENVRHYVSFIHRLCRQDDLPAFDKSGTTATIEYGARLSGKNNKLSLRFNRIADLIREAAFYCAGENKKKVTRRHVEQAISAKKHRLGLYEDKLQEMISENTIFIDTTGSKIGQVNGLSVLTTGDYTFGRPSRISAQVSAGRRGVLNIEREVALSGPIHDKGVLIIAGYLRSRFAHNKPMAIDASICFEQSYSEVDGDSASSAEIYAILSGLGKIPLDQSIAVTGSVNQFGEIQPIGGVNEKIEGFFRVCKEKGLSGKQGVLVPMENRKDLMLDQEIIDAVKQEKFHIYAIERIDQGMEILSGRAMGEMDKEGSYPPDTVLGLCNHACQRYADLLKEYIRFSG